MTLRAGMPEPGASDRSSASRALARRRARRPPPAALARGAPSPRDAERARDASRDAARGSCRVRLLCEHGHSPRRFAAVASRGSAARRRPRRASAQSATTVSTSSGGDDADVAGLPRDWARRARDRADATRTRVGGPVRRRRAWCAGSGVTVVRGHQTSRTRSFSQYIVPRPRSWPIFRYGEVVAVLADERRAVGVGGDLIDGRDDRVHRRCVSSMLPPCGPLRMRTRMRVDDDERRPHEGREIGDRHVDVLVQAVAAAAEDAVPVLHRGRVLREVVVLRDGDVDDLVRVDERA